MERTVPIKVSIRHVSGPRITNTFYSSLTPPDLENREIVLSDPLPPTTSMTAIKSILKEHHGIPPEIQWGFQCGPLGNVCLHDSTTLADLGLNARFDHHLVLLTVAWRVNDIYNSIRHQPKHLAHIKAVARYYLGKSADANGAVKDSILGKVKKCEADLASELEDFWDMVSDLVKYTGDGNESVPELSETALLGWLESYNKNGEEELHQIAAERYAALKALPRTDILLQDITDDERELVRHWLYNHFSREQQQALQDLGVKYDEMSSVLQELWLLLDETDRQPYVSMAVEERRKSYALYEDAGASQEVEEEENKSPTDRFTFDHATTNPGDGVLVRPLRNDEKALPETAFRITSGKLLWGQIQSVIAGSQAEGFDGNAERIPSAQRGGTIIQRAYNYRCAARNGNWKVRKAYSNGSDRRTQKTEFCFGWVVYHEDVDPLEAVERCSLITSGGGLSGGNTHDDKDVLYINRYDWSWLSGNRELVREVLKEEAGFRILDTEGLCEWEISGLEYQSGKWGGYMMALDAENYSPNFLASFCRDCPMPRDQTEDTELVFKQAGEDGNFGTFLSMLGTEYEFAWFVFSGKKHEKYGETDELIAIIYDGTYHVLEGDKFAVEI